MDIFDRAQEMEEQFRSMSIDAVKRLAAQQRLDQLNGSNDCAWCGEEIPKERREAIPGCCLCIACQSQKENLKERG